MGGEGCVLFSVLLLHIYFATMLSDADAIGQKYAKETAKRPPPSPIPQTKSLLASTSSWLSIDLRSLTPREEMSPLETLSDPALWQTFQDLGFDGVRLFPLKEGGSARTGFGISTEWGSGWGGIEEAARSHRCALIGDLMGPSVGIGADFELALQNAAGYSEMFRLIEIDPKDWTLLPKVPVGSSFANVPWIRLDALYNKGYVPEAAHPYVKESAWNATPKIKGADGAERRWIYLKEGQNDPLLAFLSPSFAADRIASADALDSIYRLKQSVLTLDAALPPFAKETSALWIRKIGGYSIAQTNGTLLDLQTCPADAAIDAPTRPALMHALLTQDARALRCIYSTYLQEKIGASRLVHALEPFDMNSFEWAEFLSNPKKRYFYGEDKISGELLRDNLLKEDLFRLNGIERQSPAPTWGRLSKLACNNEAVQEEIQKAHLLLVFAYAMQPGIFSLSAFDLLGQMQSGPKRLDFFNPNPDALYASLAAQLQSPRSFASRLKEILAVRQKSGIADADLVLVPPAAARGTLLLLHQLKKSRFYQLLAVNFSRVPAQEKIAFQGIENTWAIDLLSGQTAEKGFEAGAFFFDLPPLSGKVFLFQPKYYD